MRGLVTPLARISIFISRLRAIEEGQAVYRLANTGVSGGFDGFGRLLGKTDLGTKAVIDLPHIGALAPPFYAKKPHHCACFALCLAGGSGYFS